MRKLVVRGLLFAIKLFSKKQHNQLVAVNNVFKGYLTTEGWVESMKSYLPVDKEGKAIPWFAYSSIFFLDSRIDKQKKFKVFEYGSGNSTLWFSERVISVTSVEHNEAWYSEFKKNLEDIDNVDYLLIPDFSEYEKRILGYNNEFDVIVVDGERRVECCMNSLNALKEDGIIIWDNSDRDIYSEGFNFLSKKNFKRIDFSGLSSLIDYQTVTSIF